VVELLQAVLERLVPFNEYIVEEFVAFAVRGLVEIRQLDQEPIQSFAQRLTDWIVNGNTYFELDKLLSALRLCGPAWPGTARLSVQALGAEGREASVLTKLVRSQSGHEEMETTLMAAAMAVVNRSDDPET
jgi:hypothetical protein